VVEDSTGGGWVFQIQKGFWESRLIPRRTRQGLLTAGPNSSNIANPEQLTYHEYFLIKSPTLFINLVFVRRQVFRRFLLQSRRRSHDVVLDDVLVMEFSRNSLVKAEEQRSPQSSGGDASNRAVVLKPVAQVRELYTLVGWCQLNRVLILRRARGTECQVGDLAPNLI
jgi:hypothetical protein